MHLTMPMKEYNNISNIRSSGLETVDKIIESAIPNEPNKAQISVGGGDAPTLVGGYLKT